ncbi:MAG: TonB family protein [Paludibacteraceae bacterium]|nr:TonB family protein [Paludibacteraceae bacterium]
MKNLTFILMLAIACVACTKQTKTENNATEETSTVEITTSNTEEVYSTADEMPEFPGGMGELMTYLGSNIQYPSKAKENHWEGSAVCQFVIEKDGSISNAEIIQSSGFQLLDIEAMRVILNMPNWTSGKQNGDSVRVKFALPITFKLQ